MLKLKKGLVLTLIIGCMAILTGCGNESPEIKNAVAIITPTRGHQVRGIIVFEKVEKGIRIRAKLRNLKPGKHGFHIHQYGDIAKADGTAAGGHFNPENAPHGAPKEKARHIGDLGNITADENGLAFIELIDEHICFKGTPSIIGRAVIIHADPDTFKQPTGGAGTRIGQGVIGIRKP